jgi:hypothetical protein
VRIQIGIHGASGSIVALERCVLFTLLFSLTTWASTGTEVGVGIRQADASDLNSGAVYMGHYRMPMGTALMGEISAGYAPAGGGANGINGLARTLVNMFNSEGAREFAVQARTESWSLRGLADWSIVERTASSGWTGGPRLVGGAMIYKSTDFTLVQDNWEGDFTAIAGSSKIQLGAVAGVRLDLWGQTPFGFRMNVLNRFTFVPTSLLEDSYGKAQNGEKLRHSVVTSFDLLWRL